MNYDTMTIESLAHDCFKRSGYNINKQDLISRINFLCEKYHEAELKKLRVGDVMVELPICISGSSNNFAGICTACGKRH